MTAGHVPGAGQVPLADGGGQGLPGVQPGQFGGAHGAPQPFGLVARLAAVARREGVHEQVPVVLLTRGGGLGCPDGVQDRQVVGVGQGLLLGLGGGQLLAVALQHVGQHAERVAGPGRRACPGGSPPRPAVRRS